MLPIICKSDPDCEHLQRLLAGRVLAEEGGTGTRGRKADAGSGKTLGTDSETGTAEGARTHAGIGQVTVSRSNSRYVMQEALLGPEMLKAAVDSYALMSLRVPGAYTLQGGLKHIGAHLHKIRLSELAVFTRATERARAQCRVLEEWMAPAPGSFVGGGKRREGMSSGFEARIVCASGFKAQGPEVLLFKMSFHPLWQAWGCPEEAGAGKGVEEGAGATRAGTARDGKCVALKVLHMAPNLMGVSLREALAGAGDADGGVDGCNNGCNVRIRMQYRTPRDQYVMMVIAFWLLGYMVCLSLRSGRRHAPVTVAGGGGGNAGRGGAKMGGGGVGGVREDKED